MSRSRFTIDGADLQRLKGLAPRLTLCVGPEFSREDLKQQVLASDIAFTGEAFTDLETLCVRLAGVDPSRALGGLARREGLRLLLAKRQVLSRLPELRRLKRQRSFLARLDRALQSGRLAFAHDAEREVLGQRLEALGGPSASRKEIEFVAAVYEAWLESADLWDLPRLMTAAIARLENGWPEDTHRPDEIRLLGYRKPEARLIALIASLERHGVSVSWPAENEVGPAPAWSWERWHTVDDAADALAAELAQTEDLSREIVLIPDEAGVKRSLKRALREAGLPLADSRDGLALRQDEKIKGALLPLQVVASRFERETVVSWIRVFGAVSRGVDRPGRILEWVPEIYSRGIQDGLESYSGGRLMELYRPLSELAKQLAGKVSLVELAQFHAECLTAAGAALPAETVAFFTGFWTAWIDEQRLLGEEGRQAPLLYWWERLRDRLDGSLLSPPRSRPVAGVHVYRLSQGVPFREIPKSRLWILGLSADHVESPVGDYWYSVREREALSPEFPVRSSLDSRHERFEILKDWVTWAETARVLDYAHDWNGAERESPVALLRKLPGFAVEEPVEKGAVARWLPSFGGARTMPSLSLDLHVPRHGPESRVRIEATELEYLSRCGFQWVGYSRWKLRDLEEPDIEPPPHIKGTLLHAAVEALVRSRDSRGVFGRTPAEVLDEVWRSKGMRGLLKGRRLEGYVKRSLLEVLERFSDEEREYASRSGTQVLSLEDDTRLELEFPEGIVHGRPDRIDEHRDGIFVIDYKSSLNVPTGRQMLEEGYRLQLAFYSLASARKFGKPVIGAQFISLVPAGGRRRGIFFPKWNGKVDFALTTAAATNGSLLKERIPEEVWPEFEEKVREVLRAYGTGRFTIAPKDPVAECRGCRLKVVCGRLRWISEEDEAAS